MLEFVLFYDFSVKVTVSKKLSTMLSEYFYTKLKLYGRQMFLILMKATLLIIFICSKFCVLLQKLMCTEKSENIFSNSFSIPPFSFRLMIHVDFSYVYCTRKKSCFIVFHYTYSLFIGHLLKSSNPPLSYSEIYAIIQVNI